MDKLKLQEWAHSNGFKIINEDKTKKHYSNYILLIWLFLLCSATTLVLVGALVTTENLENRANEPALNVEIGGNVNLYFASLQDSANNNGEVPELWSEQTTTATKQTR